MESIGIILVFIVVTFFSLAILSSIIKTSVEHGIINAYNKINAANTPSASYVWSCIFCRGVNNTPSSICTTCGKDNNVKK